MKICFVGVGSIGARHIKNLKELCGSGVQIDALRSGKGSALQAEIRQSIDRVCEREEELAETYDAVFITNPTACHYETLRRLARRARAFFIEKPVFSDKNADPAGLHLQPGTICYVAAPLRYHSVIQYLKREIDFSGVYAARCISSSYLPDWRPGVDYRKTYSASRALGGGVAIDLIHEWDYLTCLMGLPEQVNRLSGKVSALEIDSEDIAVYIARYPDKFVELHLDYFGRYPIRRLELFLREDTLECDLLAHSVRWLRAGRKIELPQERDAFQKAELLHFLDILAGKQENDNEIEHACQVMRLAEE